MARQITVDALVEWGAKRSLTYQYPEASQAQRDAVIRPAKWNLLVNGFNGSTVLLVAALASAILLSFQTAFVLGTIGLFARVLTERECAYTIARLTAEEGHAEQVVRLAAHTLGIRPANMERVILERLGVGVVENWEENAVLFDRYPIWKNKVPIHIG